MRLLATRRRSPAGAQGRCRTAAAAIDGTSEPGNGPLRGGHTKLEHVLGPLRPLVLLFRNRVKRRLELRLREVPREPVPVEEPRRRLVLLLVVVVERVFIVVLVCSLVRERLVCRLALKLPLMLSQGQQVVGLLCQWLLCLALVMHLRHM